MIGANPAFFFNQSTSIIGSKRKRGSGKSTPQVPQTPTNATEDEDVELASEDEVEFDEDAELMDSDDSGSDFEASSLSSEDELEAYGKKLRSPRKSTLPSSDGSDSEAEAQLIGLAIQLSKQTEEEDEDVRAILNSSGPSASNASALRAAAAERRRASALKFDVDDSHISIADSNSAESSDEEPLAKGKGKVKGKAAPKGKGKAPANTDKKNMSWAELRAQKRAAAAALRAERRSNKSEEAAMRKKLGRKLTHAEKTTIALHKHHEELRNVWGDLEMRVKPVKPLTAEQPDDLKITLLPFQLESLYWMREQEKGEWHGGMLAVSSINFSLFVYDNLQWLCRMRWGKVIWILDV